MNKLSCFNYFKRNESAKIRLVCFHYAGGYAELFHSWNKNLPETIEVCAVQLPGRMSLSSLKPYTEMNSLINYLQKEVLPHLMSKPFVFLGHSLGGLVCFELARFLQKYRGLVPQKLIISASQSPNSNRKKKKISHLSDQAIIEELIAYKHTSAEVLANEELMRIILPIVRADFTINEHYQYIKDTVLNCPITVYAGIDDEITQNNELKDWSTETNKEFKLKIIPGDHFYLFKQNNLFFEQLSNEILCTQ